MSHALLRGADVALPTGTVLDLIDFDNEAVAICQGNRTITYRQLCSQVRKTAQMLRRKGVRAEDRVLLAGAWSPELLTALLAVMVAGGTYVPIDPRQPPRRLLAMVTNAAARWAFVDQPDQSLPGFDGDLIPLAATQPDQPDVEADEDLPAIDPASAAYVMYTSGSTGTPKGVVVEHRSLLNYASWTAAQYLTPGAGAAAHSPLTFDLTITSLFGPLVVGGTVTLPVDQTGHALLALGDLVGVGGYGLLKITPAHLEALNGVLAPAAMAGVAARLIVGGEQLYGAVMRTWRRHAPSTVVVNEYGPTEATVGCCTYATAAADLPDGPVPIGRPIANTSLYVVTPDDPTTPAALETIGELFIAGVGLARGYLGNASATAIRFIPDPFGEPGARAYRTGDLVRLGSDGNLAYHGRIDDQLKIGGHRVEPAEIVAALRAVPEVDQAVVVMQNGTLVGYAVPAPGSAPPAVGDIDRELSQRLPQYMRPRRLVWLAALPLTENGKVATAELSPVGALRCDSLGGRLRRPPAAP